MVYGFLGRSHVTLVVKKKETIIVDPEGIVIGAIMVIETMEVIKTVEVADTFCTVSMFGICSLDDLAFGFVSIQDSSNCILATLFIVSLIIQRPSPSPTEPLEPRLEPRRLPSSRSP